MLPILLIGSFLAFLDFFIVNIALPAMRVDLDASPAQLQFVVAAYGIGFGVSLITGGRLGDIYGRKRMFLCGVAGFTLASALCGLAPSPDVLIAARVLQAVAAAVLVPQVLAIIRTEFAPQEHAFAIGLYGTSMGFASIVAQLLGGMLVTLNLHGWSWRLIFLVNIPIGIAAVSLAARLVQESRGARRPTLDFIGVGLASLSLFLLIYPIVEGRQAAWPPWSWVMLAAALPVATVFLAQQRRVLRGGRTPLVALHLFRVPAIQLGLIISMVFFSGLAAFFVLLTVLLQDGFGYAAFAAGLLFLPFAVGFVVSSALSGPITARLGRWIVNLGVALMAAGVLVLILLAQHAAMASPVVPIEPRLLLVVFLIYGIGQGLAQPALITIVVAGSGVSGEDAGSAAGLFLTTAQSSIALGVAVIGDVFFARLGMAPDPAAYLTALSVALTCNLVLLAATFVLVPWLPRAGSARADMSA
jgi:EmrB/QacA subfamily drug resistance transporter